MDILGHGVDLVDMAEIKRLLSHGDHFMARTFTALERSTSADRPDKLQYLAGRFASKEAVLKALGTGWSAGVSFQDVDIQTLPSGAPIVVLSGRAAEIAHSKGIVHWWLSISHTTTHAVASAIATGSSP